MVEISTSLLNVDKEESVLTFYNLEVAHTDYFHIDVMDGKFVQNYTHDRMKEYSEQIKQISTLPLDIHLMVEEVKKYVDIYLALEPNIITFHLEAIKNKEKIKDIISYIKQNNCKVGIAIKPGTNIEDIYEFLPYIHMVLVMTVDPGKGGQKLIPETIEKVRNLKKYLIRNNLDIDIEVDGGVNLENVQSLKSAGVDIIVAGVAIVKSDDYKDTIEKLRM